MPPHWTRSHAERLPPHRRPPATAAANWRQASHWQLRECLAEKLRRSGCANDAFPRRSVQGRGTPAPADDSNRTPSEERCSYGLIPATCPAALGPAACIAFGMPTARRPDPETSVTCCSVRQSAAVSQRMNPCERRSSWLLPTAAGRLVRKTPSCPSNGQPARRCAKTSKWLRGRIYNDSQRFGQSARRLLLARNRNVHRPKSLGRRTRKLKITPLGE